MTTYSDTLRRLLPFATAKRVAKLEDALRELSDRVSQVEQGHIKIHLPDEFRASFRDSVANLKVKNLEYRSESVERAKVHESTPSSVAPTSPGVASATSAAASISGAPEGTARRGSHGPGAPSREES